MHMTARLTHIILCLICLLANGAHPARAQREKHNIYLFDCTGSMIRGDLWEPARAALDETVAVQTSVAGSTFTVIPFGDEPYRTFSFGADGYASAKGKIFAAFDDYVKQARHTRISDVLRSGFADVDPHKENRIYLLTDGEPNGGDSPARVAALLDEWCASHRNTRLFYVALKPGVVNPAIAAAVDRCRDIIVVPCDDGVIPQIADISGEIHANIEELDSRHTLRLSIPLPLEVDVACDDPIFEATVPGGKTLPDGTIPVCLRSRDGLTPDALHTRLAAETAGAGDYTFTVGLTCADKHYIIANPRVRVAMADHVQSRLSTAGGADGEIAARGCGWHDAFLWSGAAELDEAGFDLAPEFTAAGSDACLTLSAEPAEGDTRDFTLRINGRELPAGSTFDIRPGEPCRLSVTFDTDAATGKRYIRLTRKSSRGIDLIDGRDAADFDSITLRTAYTVSWNPLKTALTWLGAAALAALLLWLLVARRIVYPPIAVNRMELRGPGTYYLAPKRIRGARKVVLTARRRSQSIIGRAMTGRVIYVAAPHFTPEVEILPAGRGKRVKLRTGGAGGWTATPSAIIGAYQSATLCSDNQKFTIDIS